MALTFPYTLKDGTNYEWTFNSYGEVVSGTRSEFYYGADISPSVYWSNTSTENGGRELVFQPSSSSSGLEQVRKVYVSGKEGFVRYLEIFTNTGTTTVTKSVQLSSSLNSYSPDVIRTSDGDNQLSTADNWIVRDNTTDTHAAVTHVVSGQSGVDPSSVSLSSYYLSYNFDLTLKPGETKIIMHYLALDASASAGVSQANSLTALKGDALAGMSDFEIDHVVNFSPYETIKLSYNGTSKADMLVGDRYDETFKAGAGNDLVSGADGNDRIYGDDGNDTLLGGDGDDRIYGGFGKDTIDGGNGDDLIIGDIGSGLVTTTATRTIASTGEKLSVSLTLPDQDNGTSIPVSGFVSRTPVTSNQFNIAFVIDVSGSTSSTFSGSVTVGDKNGDGVSNTVLDAEIAGFEALLKGITKQVGAENVNVAVIPFESGASTAFAGNAAKDSDGDGLSDVIESLRSLDDLGSTDFEAGLQEAIKFFNGTTDGQNLVFFLSDGGNNDGGSTAEEVTTLRSKTGINATIKSFGVGSSAVKTDLDLVDDKTANDSVQIVLNPADLSKVLIDPGIKKSDVKAVEIYVNGKLAKTIPGSKLSETPLGLNFSFDTVLTGLQASKDDKIIAKVIAADTNGTSVSTSQVVEVLKQTDADDTILGGNGDDLIWGGGGNDTVHGEAGNDILYGEAGSDKLYGGRGTDALYGGDGNDTLNGGLGVDRMTGGAGNDTYYVDRSADKVIEISGGGTDTVRASVNYTLANHVEKLVLTGSAANGTGNASANSITGNSSNNVLNGKAGNDTLNGGAGNDRLYGDVGNDTLIGGSGDDVLYGGQGKDKLTGSAGKDSFVFNTVSLIAADNVDTITDFVVKDDTIWLENSVFTKVGSAGKLASSAFHIGSAAADASDRIIYNSSTGALSYDADGKGGAAAVQIATLSSKLALTAADFLVI